LQNSKEILYLCQKIGLNGKISFGKNDPVEKFIQPKATDYQGGTTGGKNLADERIRKAGIQPGYLHQF
jgi:hypothetical protein